TPGKPASVTHFLQSTTRMSGTESSTEHAESTKFGKSRITFHYTRPWSSHLIIFGLDSFGISKF
ncbi:hypothetical protein J1605_011705, partial [Eschrichtius robustus]